MMALLKKDLERVYYFEGHPDRKASPGDVWRRALTPRFLPVILCRMSHALYYRKHTVLSRLVSLLNFQLFGIEIAMRCEIGPGLYFPHTIGTVIGALRIGCNVLIYNGVTLGAKEMDLSYSSEKRPIVGDNVIIGSGAKVLGGITLGDNVIVGANAVVTHSIPVNAVVGGVPARILRSSNNEVKQVP